MNDTVKRIEQLWHAASKSRNLIKPEYIDLSDAIKKYIRPNDILYFGGSMARPNGAMFEIIRQFWDTNPEFTIVAPAIANQHAPLVLGGLTKKIITAIHAVTYPTPAPHPLYVEADKNGSTEFECWSLLTFCQRLIAAALGWPFIPTQSLSDSDMYDTLKKQGHVDNIVSPFADGDSVCVVKPLVPDVTIVHAIAADEDGNILIPPPLYDGVWAAFATKRTVIVTVDYVVSKSEAKKYANHVKIPSEVVTAICQVPLGSHPNSMPNTGMPELPGYVDDYDFLTNLKYVGKTKESLLKWTKEWILDCANHNEYLKKLGRDHIDILRGRALRDSWRYQFISREPIANGNPTKNERHVALAARTVARYLENKDISAILAGLGISSLGAWAAAINKGLDGVNVPLMVESGLYGYIPVPGDPFLFNYHNMVGSEMLSDIFTSLGLLTMRANNQTLGVLGAAQIDKFGNLNSNRLPQMLLTGSGGANDIGSKASKLIITIPLHKMRIVEKVDYVTTPGKAVIAIVTPEAIFERDNGDDQFVLTRVYLEADETKEACIDKIKAECPWDLIISDHIQIEDLINDDELFLVRALDPDSLFTK